ncbi:MAG: tRNA 4-thiouridine(8) synthase ThiI [Caldimicrobium sp.]
MAKVLLLFSEGLDSTLAGLILKREGIEVIAVRFITPFFGWKYKKEPQAFVEKIKTLGFDEGLVIDITEEYLELLKSPKHGYGHYANPCIDCKIFFLKKAGALMKELSADFLATGEVLGQRPMSQNKMAMEIIEKEAGVEGLLLRPLSAKLLKETLPEKKGLVKRENLYGHWGRKRTFQLELAQTFGLEEIPTPAGGCLLTDPIIGTRVLRVLKEKRTFTPLTSLLLTFGRHHFDEKIWIILGRNEEENKRLKEIVNSSYPLFTLNEPSPLLAVIEGAPSEEYLKNLLLQYSKKARKKLEEGGKIELIRI